jgi:hypothetical protein
VKWIHIQSEPHPKGKTMVHWVYSKETQFTLGEIRWYGRWRKYCFFPVISSLFEQDCLRDIADFCENATKEHWESKKEKA